MKRKVVRHGASTLTISLPSKWAADRGIKSGDELELMEDGQNLVVGGSQRKVKSEEVQVDITGLDRSSILLYIQSLYKYGYDTIDIITEDKTVDHFRKETTKPISTIVHNSLRRLVGAEIISSGEKNFTIKYITKDSDEDFQLIMRRVFRLINEMFDFFLLAAKNKDLDEMQQIEFLHVNLKNFINYCLRLLNKYNYPDVRKTCFYFTIIHYLSKTEDVVKNHARIMIKNKYEVGKVFLDEFKKIANLFNHYYELFYDYDKSKCKELARLRDELKFGLTVILPKLTKVEGYLIGGLSQIVEIILDMYELKISLES